MFVGLDFYYSVLTNFMSWYYLHSGSYSAFGFKYTKIIALCCARTSTHQMHNLLQFAHTSSCHIPHKENTHLRWRPHCTYIIALYHVQIKFLSQMENLKIHHCTICAQPNIRLHAKLIAYTTTHCTISLQGQDILSPIPPHRSMIVN